MSALKLVRPQYRDILTRYILAESDWARENALFEASELSKAMLANGIDTDWATDVHRHAQEELVLQWSVPGANEAQLEARDRLALGDALPLLLALKMPHEMARQAQQESRWRVENGKLLAMFEQTSDLMLILDAKGQVQDANPAYCKASGMRKAAVLAEPPPWPAPLPSVHTWHDQREHQRGDGSRYTVAWSISPITDRDGCLISHVCTGRDITRQQRIDEGLRQNNQLRAVATLACGMAHDFNNLLGSIMGLTELSALDASEGSRQAQNLGKVLQASQRAANLVRQLLDFSRQTPSERGPVQISNWLMHMQGLIHASLPPHIIWREELGGDPIVLMDQVQMEQVMLNIVSNAAHAMQERGGILALRSWIDGDQLRLDVIDTGEGMAPDVQARIFEPFFTTKPVGEGTGLGLSAAHGIVTQHGGRIEVRSLLGRGTTVSVFLPL
jgi:signal transduction histidine kinase